MKTGSKGINLIKEFEGCRLAAYKCPAGVWTIGYGHTGSDVFSGLSITHERAEELLKKDLEKYEEYVEKYVSFPMNQNQFDALVSFTYNCGAGNLQQLVKGRDADTVAEKLRLYNKANGKTLAGLVRRREAERELFLQSDGETDKTPAPVNVDRPTVRRGDRDAVRELQEALVEKGYSCGAAGADGIFGSGTENAVKAFQRRNGLSVDGIVGKNTWGKLLG